MIVCLCRGISDGEIRAVVAQGACSAEAVAASCGAGADCGTCMLWLADYLAESDATLITPGGAHEGVACEATSGSSRP